jgi:polysaccharide pyruvyl transferase WcaK-like protein
MPSPEARTRILVEPSDYTFFNVGDVAMIQAALSRLDTLFPDSLIQVLTDDPDGLALHCARAMPLSRRGRQQWLSSGHWLAKVARARPWSRPVESIVQLRMKLRGVALGHVREFRDAVAGADLIVVTGMGGITDWFEEYALELLDVLSLGIREGKPTAMLGQGIGPLHSRRLWARASQVLPHVDLIALREDRGGKPLLKALGVPAARVVTTGDDAIELAHALRSPSIGSGLGVNLRVGWYSEVGAHLVERLRPILQNVARTYTAPLVAVPVSCTPGEADAVTIQELTAGYGAVLGEGNDLDTPRSVIEQVRLCRVVVTGSYHAAVFALSQGIPAIGLANSSYYASKFEGLTEQFGQGSDVVWLDDARLECNLSAAIEAAWASAERLRPRLLAAAARQIELGQAVYQRLAELVAPHWAAEARV